MEGKRFMVLAVISSFMVDGLMMGIGFWDFFVTFSRSN
jgi:hypothetical protein